MQEKPQPVSADNCYGWARVSVFDRLPQILQEAIQSSSINPPGFQIILNDIKENAALSKIQTGPETEYFNDKLEGLTWGNAPWFFLESYFYRRIFDATDFFTNKIDPFANLKQKQLKESLPALHQLSKILKTLIEPTTMTQDFFSVCLYDCLWGNKADLSLNPKGFSKEQLSQKMTDDSKILINHSSNLYNFFSKLKDGRLDFVVDNVALDFVSDLMFATLLTHYNHAKVVYFHVKTNPIFVSDVTKPDFDYMMSTLAEELGPLHEFHELWKSYFSSGRWVLTDHLYWNRFEPFWDMPTDLHQEFEKSDLVIIKGDALARRVHGDLRWPFTTPTEEIASYFPSNLLMLRTLKSETATGLTQKQVDDLSSSGDLKWLSQGIYAIVQFLPKNKK